MLTATESQFNCSKLSLDHFQASQKGAGIVIMNQVYFVTLCFLFLYNIHFFWKWLCRLFHVHFFSLQAMCHTENWQLVSLFSNQKVTCTFKDNFWCNKSIQPAMFGLPWWKKKIRIQLNLLACVKYACQIKLIQILKYLVGLFSTNNSKSWFHRTANSMLRNFFNVLVWGKKIFFVTKLNKKSLCLSDTHGLLYICIIWVQPLPVPCCDSALEQSGLTVDRTRLNLSLPAGYATVNTASCGSQPKHLCCLNLVGISGVPASSAPDGKSLTLSPVVLNQCLFTLERQYFIRTGAKFKKIWTVMFKNGQFDFLRRNVLKHKCS